LPDPPDSSSAPNSSVIQKLADSIKVLVSVIKDQVLAVVVIGILVAAIVLILGLSVAGVAGIIAFFVLVVVLVVLAVLYGWRRDVNEFTKPAAPSMTNTIAYSTQLTSDEIELIKQMLAGATRDTAAALGVDASLVRANIFGLADDGHLHIVPTLVFNMNHAPELTLAIPPGYGSSGRCFESSTPNIAVFKRGWGANALAGSEMPKLNPGLRWIVSMPVFAGPAGSPPTWILNVDGIDQQASEENLQATIGHLVYWAESISLVLKGVIERSTR
jgi:hypothetical protein